MEAEHAILQCQTKSEVFDTIPHQRRSANYKPNIWKTDFLESLDSKYDVSLLVIHKHIYSHTYVYTFLPGFSSNRTHATLFICVLYYWKYSL